MGEPLLHLTTTAGWRAALATGAVEPGPGPFVHLSTATQVAVPAGRLFRGRRDVVLLVLDPARIGADVRFEEGDPPHPDGWRFPHAYGRVPAAAVLAAVPYRPRPDGGFDAPRLPAVDAAGRWLVTEPALLRRAATGEVPVTGGVAIVTGPFPAAYKGNQLLVTDPATPEDIEADGDRVLGGHGLGHRVAVLLGARHAATATALADRGWTVHDEVGMARPLPAPAGERARGVRVEEVAPSTLRPLWRATRRERHPDISDTEIDQMAARHIAADQVADVRHLVVHAAGDPVAVCVLTIDGATALLGPLDTVAGFRRRGYGDAVLTEALSVAAAAGCDLAVLDALADDWPRAWYARRGFVEVGRSWVAYRPA